jgi:chaperonin GroES
LALSLRECQPSDEVKVWHPRRQAHPGRLSVCGWSSGQPKIAIVRGGQIVTTATKVVLKPLEDRIVVQPLEAEQTTASGLVIPDTAKEKPQEGSVLAVGPGRWDEDGDKRIPLDVKVGDIVLYSKYGGTEVKYNNEEYLVLSARDVLAVVEK